MYLDEDKEIDLVYVDEVMNNACEDALEIIDFIYDNDTNSRTYHLKSKPNFDVESILHDRLKEYYPEIDDKIQLFIDKIDDTTINVKYRLILDGDEIFNLIHHFIMNQYEVVEYDDFDNYIDYLCKNNNDRKINCKDIYDYLATVGISDDKVQLKIDLYNLEFFNYYEFRIIIAVKDDKYCKIVEYKRRLHNALLYHWNTFDSYTNPVCFDEETNKFTFCLHYTLIGEYDKDRIDLDICNVLVENHLTNNDASYFLNFKKDKFRNASEKEKYGSEYYTSLELTIEIKS